MVEILVETRHGPARVHLSSADPPRGALLLGHGAGGAVQAADLQAAAAAARELRYAVGLVEQPYRVRGRRAPAPARQLDAALLDVVEDLRAGPLAELPLVLGGRSMGARVACRTAGPAAARGVLCLAFPLLPPRRAGSGPAPPSRIAELDAVSAPVLVVQGRRDRFGAPPPGPGRTVVEVDGDHRLRADLPAVGTAVGQWLGGLEIGS